MDTIRLKNYRCFNDTGEIHLKPVNILLGRNSVGKSSFLKFFPLLKQSRVKHPNGLFLWYAEDVDFKDFKNTVKDGEGNIEISFKFDRIFNIPGSGRNPNRSVEITVTLTIASHPKDENLDYLSKLKISFEDIQIELSFSPAEEKKFMLPLKEFKINGASIDKCLGTIPQFSDDGFLPKVFFRMGKDDTSGFSSAPYLESGISIHDFIQTLDYKGLDSPRNSYIYNKYRSVEELTQLFDMQSNEIKKQVKNPKGFIEIIYQFLLNDIIDDINAYVDSLARNISYIQPVRANAKRYYRFQNLAVDEIDSHGDNLPMYLNSLSGNEMKNLNDWIDPLFKFQLLVSPKEGHIQINIIETENKSQENQTIRNLVDVGFGYSQLLPIIVQIWNSLRDRTARNPILRRSLNRTKIIVIEQPELHLHPRMMGFFAKMLISVIGSTGNGVRFIIETHSEALIEALGRYIIEFNGEKSFNPKDIQILIFDNENNSAETSIIATSYKNDGLIEKWPYGFFSEDDY